MSGDSPLFIPTEGISGPAPQAIFLDDQSRPGHLKDIVSSGQAHLILETLREPEHLLETDLLPGGVVGELRAVDIHVLEVKLRETAFLGQGDTGLAQGKIEMDAGIIDLVPGLQCPHAVDGPGVISGMPDIRHPAGRQQGKAGDNRRE